MKRVTGIGGVFFKANDAKASGEWYARHLGIPIDKEWNGAQFPWRNRDDPAKLGHTVLGLFGRDTTYFDPGKASFMVNFRVDDLDAVLAALAAEGVKIAPKREDSEFGRFAWIYDPDGNKLELWEPPEGERG